MFKKVQKLSLAQTGQKTIGPKNLIVSAGELVILSIYNPLSKNIIFSNQKHDNLETMPSLLTQTCLHILPKTTTTTAQPTPKHTPGNIQNSLCQIIVYKPLFRCQSWAHSCKLKTILIDNANYLQSQINCQTFQ